MDIEAMTALHDSMRAGEGLEQAEMNQLHAFYKAMGSPRNDAELALSIWYLEEVAP